MEITEIKPKEELENFCIFGHEKYSCPYIGIEKIDYCVFGRCEECEHYKEQLKLKEK